MKTSLPYVPWYHGDFLRSTVGWTLTEQAAYWKLLCAQWEIGPLPDDPSRLASIIGTDDGEFTSLWAVVRLKFERTTAGLVNARMEAHRLKYLEYCAQQSVRGKKGMAARWGARKVVPLRSADGGRDE